jgi:hypothetical protein
MLTIVHDVGPAHETEKRLVDQSRGLQCMLPGFAPHLASRQVMKLRIQGADHGVHGLRIAVAHAGKQRGQISTAGGHLLCSELKEDREARF